MVSDEKILKALLTTGTVKESAIVLGISESTIYARMKKAEFINKLDFAKWEILEKIKDSLVKESTNAITVISSIMHDTEVNSAVRLQSAQTIINTTLKFLEVSNKVSGNIRDSQRGEWLDISL